jgi:hypothetical protein
VSIGQASLISHTFSVSFTIIIILLIVISFNNIRNDYKAFSMKNQINGVCDIIKGAVEKIYWPFDYESDGTFGRIFVDLPERIGDTNYRARFLGSSLLIESGINSTCSIGFNITYAGSTTGGRTEIEWTRAGTVDKITMVKK